MPNAPDDDILLLPAPATLRRQGGTVTMPDPDHTGAYAGRITTAMRVENQPGVPPESYRLEVGGGEVPNGVLLVAASATGLQQGSRTLSQLQRQFGRHLPRVLIEDAPSFTTRGVMLDVSRDRVPTMAHFEEVIGLLASWKVNHLQLYTEHTFAYRGHEKVWEDCSPLTPAEVRHLDTFCRERSIELAANQNCFGHLHRWLALPQYAELAETTGNWSFMEFPRQGGFSLCPGDPRSLALVEDLLGQLMPCFKSRRVNIGCDETYDVGQGRSRAEVEARGRPAVYFEFLRKVVDAARRHGGEPMFWADIAVSHPEAIGEIPPGVLALAWGYEPDSPFDLWGELLGGAGREMWVCPGTSSWRTILGRTWERRANLKNAALAGVAARATGNLITDWGDLGHRQQWPISLRGLADGAARAWNAGAEPDPRAVSLHAFGDEQLAVATWLDLAGDADADLRAIAGRPDASGKSTRLRNASALFADFEEPFKGGRPIASAALWEACEERLAGLGDSMPRGVSQAVAAELTHSLAVARLAARRGRLRAAGGAIPAPEQRELAKNLSNLIAEHRDLWLARSRPGGLDASCQHYERVARELDG